MHFDYLYKALLWSLNLTPSDTGLFYPQGVLCLLSKLNIKLEFMDLAHSTVNAEGSDIDHIYHRKTLKSCELS